MAEEKLLLLKNIRSEGYRGDYASYKKPGGGNALRHALTNMTPAERI